MTEVQRILKDYNEAMEINDMFKMIELIDEMKMVDPVFVNLMVNAYEDDEAEDWI